MYRGAPLGTDGRDARPYKTQPELQTFLAEEVDQIANPARIAPFIVVPGNDLDHVAADHHGGRRVQNRGAAIAAEIRRYQLVLLVSEIALQRSIFRGLLHG